MADALEKWRELFRGADIYNVIDHAILVAAADSPQELRRRRDGIAERLYTTATTAAPVPSPCIPGKADAVEDHGSAARASSDKHSKVASCNGTPGDAEDDDNDVERLRGAAIDDGHGHDNGNAHDDEAYLPFETHMIENLADQIDEDTKEINEVLRIKEILINYQEQSAGILFESLRRLQLMELSVEKLESTQIGGAVTPLRKHSSPEIRQLVRDLVRDWRATVDEWVSATNATIANNSDTTPDSSNPSAVEDEDRLLTPPMDVGAFFMTQVTAIHNLSKFFDGIDDDGNMISSIDSNGGSGNKIQNNGVRPSNHAPAVMKQQAAQPLPKADEKTLSMKQDLLTRQEPPLRQTKPQKPLNADGDTLPMRQVLPTGQGPPLRQTNPQKLIKAGENTVLKSQGLPARQEPALRQTNLQKPQGPRSQMNPPRVLIQLKHSGAEYEPRRLFEETPQNKPCVQMEPRPTQEPIAVATKPTVAVATKPLSGHVNKPEMPAQASAGPKVGMGKRKIQLADMGLETTKRRLQEAYQEAENARKQRSVQVMELRDIPKFKQSKSTPIMKSRKNNTRAWAPNVRRK